MLIWHEFLIDLVYQSCSCMYQTRLCTKHVLVPYILWYKYIVVFDFSYTIKLYIFLCHLVN